MKLYSFEFQFLTSDIASYIAFIWISERELTVFSVNFTNDLQIAEKFECYSSHHICISSDGPATPVTGRHKQNDMPLWMVVA